MFAKNGIVDQVTLTLERKTKLKKEPQLALLFYSSKILIKKLTASALKLVVL